MKYIKILTAALGIVGLQFAFAPVTEAAPVQQEKSAKTDASAKQSKKPITRHHLRNRPHRLHRN